jgi:hypothetical protein
MRKASVTLASFFVRIGSRTGSAARSADRHDLRFFRGGEAIDLGDRAIGQALQFIERTALLVFRDRLVLEQAFGMVVRVAAQVAHRDPRVLGGVAHDFRQVAAPLFGQRRHRHAQQVALGRRIEAEVGLADRALDLRAHALFPRLHADRAGV